jgi:hypothetical protein
MNPWTDKEVDLLRAGHRKGCTMQEISNQLKAAGYNRDRMSVIGKWHRLGGGGKVYIPVKKVLQAKTQEMEMGPVGQYTFEQIAGNFDMCHYPKAEKSWCGKPTVNGPYCAECNEKVYAKSQPKARFGNA